MKKAYLVLVALIAILSISAVSAGLFDFGSDDSSKSEQFNISGTIIDSSFTYKITGKADTSDNPGEPLTEDSFQYYMNGSGVVKVNVSNATDEQLENISKIIEGYDFDNGSDFFISLYTNLNESNDILAGHVKSVALNGTVLTIEFSDYKEISKKMQGGTTTVKTGDLDYGNSSSGFRVSFYTADD